MLLGREGEGAENYLEFHGINNSKQKIDSVITQITLEEGFNYNKCIALTVAKK